MPAYREVMPIMAMLGSVILAGCLSSGGAEPDKVCQNTCVFDHSLWGDRSLAN